MSIKGWEKNLTHEYKHEYGGIGFYEGKVKKNNVISFLDKHAQVFPNKVALRWVTRQALQSWDGICNLPHESIIYKDFIAKIYALSCGLKKAGISKGDRVIIFLPLSLELYLSMFAVQGLGAIAVFLDSWGRKEHLGVCAQVAQPKAMISLEKAFDLCSTMPELANIQLKIVVCPHEKGHTCHLESLAKGSRPQHSNRQGWYTYDLESFTNEDAICGIEPVESNDTALITFTTGSSGVPKGANRTHRFLAAQHRALEKVIPYREDDVDLPVFPIFSLNNLASGVTTILPAIDLAAPLDRDVDIIINQMLSCNVTSCTVSPSIFINISEYCSQQKLYLSQLRRVVTGGAPVSKDNVKGFKAIAPAARILVLYGSTEVEPIAHIEADEMLQDESKTEGVNVGKISEALEYKFIRIWRRYIELGPRGWEDWEIEAGKPGELVVSGSHVCEDYYNNPEAFRDTKIKEVNGKIWHRTGDVGVLDEQGRLWLMGRVHNTIVRSNVYLFPVHPEILLKRLNFIRQAAFLGIEDLRLGERACVAFSLKKGFDQKNQEAYADEIIRLFQAHKIPLDEVRMVKEIPMDLRHHSKIEYSKLREMLIQNV